MLNYIPLENRYGFSIEEVQRMMGHKYVTVTQQYAEIAMDGKNMTLKQFNEILAQKYLYKAKELNELPYD